MTIGGVAGFAVKAHDLLSGGMRESGEDARLGHGGVALVFQNSADRDVLVAEGAQQQLSRLIVTNDAKPPDVHSEGRKDGEPLGAAARDDVAITVLQNLHSRIVRD